MNPTDRIAVIAAIERADISAPVYRTARRLLDLCAVGWHVTILKGDFARMVDSDSWGTARRHLSALSAAALVHYSTNDMVYVTFLDPGSRTERANCASERAQTHLECASDDPGSRTERANCASERAQTHLECASENPSHISNNVCLFVCSDIDKQTNPRARALLTDPEVGMSPELAAEYAHIDPDMLVRHIFAWRRDLQLERDQPIHHPIRWLENKLKNGWFAPELTPFERNSALYKRHFDDDAAQRRRDYLVEEIA